MEAAQKWQDTKYASFPLLHVFENKQTKKKIQKKEVWRSKLQNPLPLQVLKSNAAGLQRSEVNNLAS